MNHNSLETARYAQTVDIKNTTFERNFCSKASSRTIWAIHDDADAGTGAESRRELYRYTREIVKASHIKRIIEVSHRSSDALSHSFEQGSCDLYGVYQQHISKQKEQSRVSVRECHLSYYPSVENCLKEFEDNVATIYILVGILEHLHDPRPLLRRLRRNLVRHRDSRAVISTTSRPGRGMAPGGLPEDKTHIREWDLGELADFIASAGFKIEKCARTASNDSDQETNDCFLELSCSDEYYTGFLRANHLPEKSDYLIVVSENGKVSKTSGIGRYVQEVQSALTNKPIVLFTGNEADITEELRNEWICPEKMVTIDRDNDVSDSVLDAFLQVIFYYENMRLVEIQDYLGQGYRIAQAKKAGLLPPDIYIKVMCHGSHAYLENARESWTPLSHLEVLYRERELIEKADLISFPNNFSKDLYIERGYEIGTESDIQPYCFTYSEDYADTAANIRTLIFFDDHTATGKYALFVGVLKELHRKGLLQTKIQRVVYISQGRAKDIVEDQYIDGLRKIIEIEDYVGDWSNVVDLISALRLGSLCVFIRSGENSPLSVLELIDSCCPFLVTNTGGISEVVPASHHALVLTENTSKDIADKIVYYLEIDDEERKKAVNNVKRTAAKKQKKINKDFREKTEELTLRNVGGCPERSVSGDLVSVIVPLFNTNPSYLQDMSLSLNNQTIRPKEVIFVDDGSEEGYLESAIETITSTLEVPSRFIRQNNKGASAAKNTAWKNATTKYIIALDHDNMLMPDFIYKTVSCIENNPDYAVVTSYFNYFNDGEDYEDQRRMSNRYRPKYGSIILGQFENKFGDNLGCYRREVLEKVGGWDEYGILKAGDWALYLNLTCRGYKIGIVNQALALYRQRGDSVLRRMNRYTSDCCIARNTVCLPRFEAYSLFGLCRTFETLQQQKAHLEQTVSAQRHELTMQQHELSAQQQELGRISVRTVRKAVALLEKTPVVGVALYKMLALIRGRSSKAE
jgi:glycosyltransferase involved in cell wall biosynthesis